MVYISLVYSINITVEKTIKDCIKGTLIIILMEKTKVFSKNIS